MFILENLTRVRCLDVRVLSQKDRKPDENPGAQLLLQATLGVGVLAMFDGFLPGMLYGKASGKSQAELAGIESVELTEIGKHVKRMPWVYEQTGCTITIDYGRGGASNIVLQDVKVHRVNLRPDAKGVVIQWTADAPGLSDAVRGKLTGLKSTDVQMLMAGPDVEGDGQQDIEGSKSARRAPAAKAAAPAPAPAEQKGPAEALADAAAGQASKDKLDAGGKSPFPKGEKPAAAPAAAPAPAPVSRRRVVNSSAAVE